jgi:hypothetical protein
MIIRWPSLTVLTQPNTNMVDVTLKLRMGRMSGFSVRWLRNVPVDEMVIRYVKPSTYTLRLIVHPSATSLSLPVKCSCVIPFTGSWTDIGDDRVALFSPYKGCCALKNCQHCRGTGVDKRSTGAVAGGNAMRIVCDECRAEYPFTWQSSPPPCANCAVMKQSGIVVELGARRWEWLQSSHGWAVKHNGEWFGVGADVKRFNSKRYAKSVASALEEQEWLKIDPEPEPYEICVEPHPHPVQVKR